MGDFPQIAPALQPLAVVVVVLGLIKHKGLVMIYWIAGIILYLFLLFVAWAILYVGSGGHQNRRNHNESR